MIKNLNNQSQSVLNNTIIPFQQKEGVIWNNNMFTIQVRNNATKPVFSDSSFKVILLNKIIKIAIFIIF